MKTYAWILGCLLWCMWTSCVTMYQSMQLTDIEINDYTDTISDKNIIISMDDDILTTPGTKQYARMEKRNDVSLVSIAIQNWGEQELNIINDFIFQTSNGDTIIPLRFEPAMELLVDPITDEDGDKESAVEIEGGSGFNLLWGAGKLANDSKKLISHIRFLKDMDTHYLENKILLSGEYIKGLLVLPVRKGIPVTASFR